MTLTVSLKKMTLTVQIDAFMNHVCAMKTVPEQCEYLKILS